MNRGTYLIIAICWVIISFTIGTSIGMMQGGIILVAGLIAIGAALWPSLR